jgi:hypothetical protein
MKTRSGNDAQVINVKTCHKIMPTKHNTQTTNDNISKSSLPSNITLLLIFVEDGLMGHSKEDDDEFDECLGKRMNAMKHRSCVN